MTWRALLNPAYVVSMVILVISALSLGRAIDAMDIYLQKLPIYPEGNRKLRQILVETDNWHRIGTDLIETAEVVKTLGTDNYLSRIYATKDREFDLAIDFHAAYYTGMVDTVPHVPERCFVGGGWQIAAESSVVDIPLDTSNWIPAPAEDGADPLYTIRVSNANDVAPGQRIELPRGVTPDGGVRMRVTMFFDPEGRKVFSGYFFIANGGTVARSEDVRLLAFSLNDDYAYYLKIQFTSAQVDTAEELAQVAGLLLDDLLPEIMLCVPRWSEVEAGRYPADRQDKDAP